MTDRAPLGAKDAAAAGLINGTMHKLDAMHRILHVNPANSSGQAPETSAESRADADTDAAPSEEARRSRSCQVETGAASGSTASTSVYCAQTDEVHTAECCSEGSNSPVVQSSLAGPGSAC